MSSISNLVSLAPNRMRDKINELIGEIRKIKPVAGTGIRITENPGGSTIESLARKTQEKNENNTYSGQWAVQLDGSYFKVPASSIGNLILTEERVFAVVTNELRTSSSISADSASWCYLRVSIDSGSAISLQVHTQPIQHLLDYSDYADDYIPLAVYSPESGLIQLQYGPVRLNRYWVYDTGAQ